MQAPIGSGFGPASTAADVIEDISLLGKTAIADRLWTLSERLTGATL